MPEKIILMPVQKIFVLSGAILGFLAVAIGAFAAHALKQKLSTEMHGIFEVGVRYQMYHALAIIIVALLYPYAPSTLMKAAGISFLIGTIIFSGSLYILALSGIKWLGAITPIGGVLFLAGWICIIIAVLKKGVA